MKAGSRMTEIINNTEVYYEKTGEGNNRVLLLHGWGCDISLMRPVADKLSPHFSLLIPDFPGHGRSGEPPEPWGVPDFASCLAELLKREHFTPCAVIAHSFGARVAAWIAANEPELFTRMILTGAAGIRPPQTEEGKKRAATYQKWKHLEQQLEKIPLMKGAAVRLKHQIQHKYGSKDYNALNDEMKKTFVKVIQQDLSDIYCRIHQPTLLMWGDQDGETPLWMGRQMEQSMQDAALILLEGGTHFAYLEQLDRFAIIAEKFLTP